MEVGETYGGRIRNICVDDKINKATAVACGVGARCTRKRREKNAPRKAHIFSSSFAAARECLFMCASVRRMIYRSRPRIDASKHQGVGDDEM